MVTVIKKNRKMINFKQKQYNAATETAKRFWEKGSNFRKGLSDPRTLLSVGSLSIAGASYHMNKQNIKDNKAAREDAHKVAVEAGKTNKELLRTLGELNDNLKKKKLISQTTVNNNTYYTKDPKQDSKQRRKFLGLFSDSENSQRQYSIESGSYKGGKRTPGQGNILVGTGLGAAGGALVGGIKGGGKGAGLGALIGAGFGAFCTWMKNIADKSVFNLGISTSANSYKLIQDIEETYAPTPDAGETTVSRTELDKTGSTTVTKKVPAKVHVQPKGLVYDIDGDPMKYPVSVLYSGNVLVLFINAVTRNQISVLNQILDKYCHSYKNADYSSTLISKDTYVIELCVVSGTECDVIYKIIDAGMKINIITGQKFGVKNYSTASDILDNTFNGATIGGIIGGPVGGYLLTKSLNGKSPTAYEMGKAGLKGLGAGMLVGAALGLICGGIKTISKTSNRNSTINDRLLPQVLEIIKKQGFKEGKNFTRDPHMADLMKIKVCITISKYSNDLQLIVNYADDPKLKDISESMTKNLPNTSRVTREMKNKFNNISITKISDGSADAGLISGIAEYYIRSGFPVYFVEVG